MLRLADFHVHRAPAVPPCFGPLFTIFLLLLQTAARGDEPIRIDPADNHLHPAPAGAAARARPAIKPVDNPMMPILVKREQKRAERIRRFEAKIDPAILEQFRAEGLVLRDVVDGQPRWDGSTNEHAAISSATDRVRGASIFGNVRGSGYRVGVWEVNIGTIHGHPEWANRMTFMDGGTGRQSTHPTHVIGTIAAAGIDESARGMAPSVTVLGFNISNDASELAANGAVSGDDFVQNNALLVSNHSYGTISGWRPTAGQREWHGPWPPGEDPTFGQYDATAVLWDTSCFGSPYLLPFKSAGNDRDDTAPVAGAGYARVTGGVATRVANYQPGAAGHPPASDATLDGGYDTIPAYGNAKNVMTVGAVDDAFLRIGGFGGSRWVPNAAISPFSNWGPSDDGRLKPDIVANGESVYSTVNTWDGAGNRTDTYGLFSGTSMATPTASGSAILLQEYFRSQFPDSLMRAATLKGLILHTADDLGPIGPDYQSGWGLMNTEAAANQIASHAENILQARIFENEIADGQSQTFDLYWDQQSESMRITLCYTDPPGTAQTGLDNATPVLVNDLDLVLSGPHGENHQPFLLDPTNPAALATRGDNDLDNVETIQVDQPAPGRYRLELSHEGPLQGEFQAYSLIISGHSIAPIVVQPVVVRPTEPYHQEFDSLPLAADGWSFRSTNSGRIVSNGSSMRMDDASIGSEDSATNAATLHLDLEGVTGAILEFRWRDYSDSPDPVPSGFPFGFSGIPEADGVAFSVDGGSTWRRLLSLPVDQFDEWRTERINLTEAMEAVGITNFSEVQIRFFQHGSRAFSRDGIDYDDVRIHFGMEGEIQIAAVQQDGIDILESSGPAMVTVERIKGNTGEVQVDYQTSGLFATGGSDFIHDSGTLTFPQGQDSVTFPVSIVNDTEPEPSERFFIRLSNPARGATLGDRKTVTIRIIDDDSPPQLDLVPSSLEPSVLSGKEAAPQSLIVRNLQGNILRYSANEDIDWLEITTGAQGEVAEHEQALIEVEYATAELPPGRYQGSLFIDDLDGHNPQREVQVTLLVGVRGETSQLTSPETEITLPSDTQGHASSWPIRFDAPSMPGRIADPFVFLSKLEHDRIADLDMVLISPAGVAVGLMSDVSEGRAFGPADLTIADSGATHFPAMQPVRGSRTYKPTNFGILRNEHPLSDEGPELWRKYLGDVSGEPVAGEWKLFIGDDSLFESGSVEKVLLALNTVTIEDVLAQHFDPSSSPFDLAGSALVFSPDPSCAEGYQFERYPINQLPIPPGGQEVVPPEDGYSVIDIAPDSFEFYGKPHHEFYLGEDGRIAFANPDDMPAADFSAIPQVSVLGMDFEHDRGTIYFEEFSDRLVVTWWNMRLEGTGGVANIQAEFFHDGMIRLSYPTVQAPTSGVAGLSRGNGQPWSTNFIGRFADRPYPNFTLIDFFFDRANQEISVTWNSQPNIVYRIQHSVDLLNWSDGAEITGDGGVLQLQPDPPKAGLRRLFHRVVRTGDTEHPIEAE